MSDTAGIPVSTDNDLYGEINMLREVLIVTAVNDPERFSLCVSDLVTIAVVGAQAVLISPEVVAETSLRLLRQAVDKVTA